ncbi:hypothetical protein Hanom_Chr06g00558191 [Helianthus anomalus]
MLSPPLISRVLRSRSALSLLPGLLSLRRRREATPPQRRRLHYHRPTVFRESKGVRVGLAARNRR